MNTQPSVVPTASGEDLAALREENARLERELQARTLEAKVTESQMSRVFSYLSGLYDLIPGVLVSLDADLRVTRCNAEAIHLLGDGSPRLPTSDARELLRDAGAILAPFLDGQRSETLRCEATLIAADGSELPVLLSAGGQYGEDGELVGLLLVAVDVRERRRLEMELRHAQKLESLGQLAAGIAHEINTPMQFISDNLHFVGQAVTDLVGLTDGTRPAAEVDLEFLRRRLPRALERAQEGVSRVSRIVGAMRLFAHPGVNPEPVDLNALVENAITVATNSYKYIADLELSLGEVPTVLAVRGDIGQVLLNLITNAAHAIEERVGGDGGRGRLAVVTRVGADGAVEVTVEDDGSGIPEDIAHRVFDPFFTTKPVGKGTGQGLAIARSIVVDKHGGELAFERVQPHGTRFIVRLPRAPSAREAA
jgi:two-component system NtrC family sensor kinase